MQAVPRDLQSGVGYIRDLKRHWPLEIKNYKFPGNRGIPSWSQNYVTPFFCSSFCFVFNSQNHGEDRP